MQKVSQTINHWVILSGEEPFIPCFPTGIRVRRTYSRCRFLLPFIAALLREEDCLLIVLKKRIQHLLAVGIPVIFR